MKCGETFLETFYFMHQINLMHKERATALLVESNFKARKKVFGNPLNQKKIRYHGHLLIMSVGVHADTLQGRGGRVEA